MRSNSRRDFLVRIVSVSATVAAGGAFASERDDDRERAGQRHRAPKVQFDYGVASGDPLSDRVILWTHARRPADQRAVELRWEVARDAGFRHVVADGEVTARPENGFTAKVDAKGLKAGRTYYYRFRSQRDVSPVGITRTLPRGDVESVKLAVFSCANYPAGFFHAYSEAVHAGAEYAVHLGDYIYEYPADGYASEDAQSLERVSVPAHECLTLSDYRARYAQYRSDPDLKQLHASMPMIAVYDDHEIANDAYKTGAENHTEGLEGAFTARTAAALKVYHEWMPIRTPDRRDLRNVYRSFDFGNLLSLHMLETRLVGRDRQIQVAELLNPATSATAAGTLVSPTRQLLGSTQMGWLTQQFAQSDATWQVLGQQTLMGRMEFPASILKALNSSDTSPEAQALGTQAITDYLTAKGTAAAIAAGAPLTLTAYQQGLLSPVYNPKLGYNLDAWDGYPAAREILLGTAAAMGKRLVNLAGDTHNAWHSALTLRDGTKVGEEFATPGVSSPGLEEYLVTLPPAQTAAIFRGVIDTLLYAETARRGFLLMTFTPEAATGEWHLLDTVKSGSYQISMDHTASFVA